MRAIKTLLTILGVAGAISFLPAANAAALQKGLHYDLIAAPQPSDAPPGKIEVIEFFSYACPHCYEFEPVIKAWSQKLPKDVVLTHVPLVSGGWSGTGKLYYALESLGVESKLRADVFKALHGDHSMKPEDDGKAWAAWAAQRGVDAKQFTVAYNFIGGKTTQALQKLKMIEGKGVPSIVVDGRYLVLSNTIESWDDLLALTDQVIAMARANKK